MYVFIVFNLFMCIPMYFANNTDDEAITRNKAYLLSSDYMGTHIAH